MEKLDRLLERLDYAVVQGKTDLDITGIAYDSRKVAKGCLFVCIKGAVSDGHAYAADAAEKGAAALLVQEDVSVSASVTVLKVPDTRYGLALASAAWFGHPAERLKVIGVTGTKGKPLPPIW